MSRDEGTDTVGSGRKVGTEKTIYGMRRCYDSIDAVEDSECHGGKIPEHGQASLSEFSTRNSPTWPRVDSFEKRTPPH